MTPQVGDRVVTEWGTGKVTLVPPAGCVFIETDFGIGRMCLPWRVKVIAREGRR